MQSFWKVFASECDGEFTLTWLSAAKSYAKIQTPFESCNSKKAKNANRAKGPLWPGLRVSFTRPECPSHYKQLNFLATVGADFMSARLLQFTNLSWKGWQFPEKINTILAIDENPIQNILISLHIQTLFNENPYI